MLLLTGALVPTCWTYTHPIFKLAVLYINNRQEIQKSTSGIGFSHRRNGNTVSIQSIRNVSQWFVLFYYYAHIRGYLVHNPHGPRQTSLYIKLCACINMYRVLRKRLSESRLDDVHRAGSKHQDANAFLLLPTDGQDPTKLKDALMVMTVLSWPKKKTKIATLKYSTYLAMPFTPLHH